ncbi:MAG: C69 family dipeptidase [Crenarchaeota archaeon]|nr:C69 family dipeptidase [Thermoproteota archaeon]
MCDTLVALKNSTKDEVTIFAKNSDREPNEPQALELYPRMEHDEEFLDCTYIRVPQVKQTYAVMISRPVWMWGAEMGVNEFGLAIGNEAVFTREDKLEKGLTGMDLLRLALERCRNSYEALMLIVKYLEEFGQGGNCGFKSKTYYHNSFIIADPREAWVLETAGKYWVAEKVKNVRSISNALTIKNKWDLASKNIVEHAVEKGWCKDDKDFDFSKCYSDWFYSHFARGRERHAYTQGCLERNIGEIDVYLVKKIMRSHMLAEEFTPAKGSMRDICMHAGILTRPSQTASSYIGQLFEKVPIHWFTATSTPCISVYKPVFIEAGLPSFKLTPDRFYDADSIWWLHEKLSRRMLGSFKEYFPRIRGQIESLEARFHHKAEELRLEFLNGKASSGELKNLTSEAFEESLRLEEGFIREVRLKSSGLLYELYWRRVNSEAAIIL